MLVVQKCVRKVLIDCTRPPWWRRSNPYCWKSTEMEISSVRNGSNYWIVIYSVSLPRWRITTANTLISAIKPWANCTPLCNYLQLPLLRCFVVWRRHPRSKIVRMSERVIETGFLQPTLHTVPRCYMNAFTGRMSGWAKLYPAVSMATATEGSMYDMQLMRGCEIFCYKRWCIGRRRAWESGLGCSCGGVWRGDHAEHVGQNWWDDCIADLCLCLICVNGRRDSDVVLTTFPSLLTTMKCMTLVVNSSSLSSLPVLRLLDAWLKRVVGSGGKGQGAWHLSSKSCCLVLCQPQRSPLSQATPGQMQFHPGVVQEGTAPVTGHRDCIRDTKRVGHTTAGWGNKGERCTVHRATVGAREREIVSWWVVG